MNDLVTLRNVTFHSPDSKATKSDLQPVSYPVGGRIGSVKLSTIFVEFLVVFVSPEVSNFAFEENPPPLIKISTAAANCKQTPGAKIQISCIKFVKISAFEGQNVTK